MGLNLRSEAGRGARVTGKVADCHAMTISEEYAGDLGHVVGELIFFCGTNFLQFSEIQISGHGHQ